MKQNRQYVLAVHYSQSDFSNSVSSWAFMLYKANEVCATPDPFLFRSTSYMAPGSLIQQVRWDSLNSIRILFDTSADRYATYISKGVLGSSEFSRRTVQLFSGTTLLSDRKFDHCRNSVSRSEEISSVKGLCETFYSIIYMYAGRAEKILFTSVNLTIYYKNIAYILIHFFNAI